MIKVSGRWALGVAGVLLMNGALAWGPDGHHTIGAIADRLMVGTRAAGEVNSLLGGLSLEDAAVWADCAKGIDPGSDYSYRPNRHYPECALHESPERIAEMADYVRRNDTNCARKPSEESCHKQYHYADVALERRAYAPGLAGTRNDDVVAAVAAALRVLKGEPVANPFNFRSKREALLVLAHFVGDLHQPLHVGAVYLDAGGRPVDPDAGTFDPGSDTRGGNEIVPATRGRRHGRGPGRNLHATWDAIPGSLKVPRIDAAWLARARAVPATRGAVYGWSSAWATDTLAQARTAFVDLQFGPLQAGRWSATLPPGYARSMTLIKQRQLTLAGARLAQLLQAIWP
jgi:hypothetical protein